MKGGLGAGEVLMAVSPDQLVVFAGAGVSLSMPANLPVFNALRNEVLNQLGLQQYMWRDGKSEAEKVAGDLAPELFMLGLSQADIDVEKWLAEVLSGAQPNAAHHALARLAAAGSRIWTVNFDTLIEQASGNTLRTVAWRPTTTLPQTRLPELLKPHGSIGGPLIVTARQVIEKLDDEWEHRLRADVHGRTVLFIGYRGRDLDFQPIWDDVLSAASEVIWFDVWTNGEMNEAAFKRGLLAGVNAHGKLELALPAPFPAGAPTAAKHNPSWDFIAWCQDRHLVDVDPSLILRLFDNPLEQKRHYPPLPGDRTWAKSAIQGMLGDYRGARASYWRAARQPRYLGKAARGLGMSYVNTGGDGMAALLTAAMLLPPYGRVGKARELALRMRLTAWSRTGRHKAVLRATRRQLSNAVSVYLILRSEALRMTGSLDEAAATAAAARQKARDEKHEIRLAHAAFQEGLALLWAHRLDELRAHLDDYLLEYARLAGNRWMAWADFVEAGWEVHSGHGEEARKRYEAAEMRFTAEGLLDGVVSVETARLAAYRLTGNIAAYGRTLQKVMELSRDGRQGDAYYTQRNDFTAKSILNDHAEFIRCSSHDLNAAQAKYAETATSRHPLQRALGHLGLALIQAERCEYPSHATAALDEAKKIGCRLVAARARELIAQPISPDALRQVYFV